jgi:hypothetical protein
MVGRSPCSGKEANLKRAIVSSLGLTVAVTAALLVWAAAAWAPPRAGAAVRTVLNDIRVCTDGGRFQVAYEPAADERPNRIRITADGTTIVDRHIRLKQRAVTFPGLTTPEGDPDPFGGVRSLSGTFTFRWRPLPVGTRLQVTIFGVADPEPSGGADFPVAGTPDIVVADCRIREKECKDD